MLKSNPLLRENYSSPHSEPSCLLFQNNFNNHGYLDSEVTEEEKHADKREWGDTNTNSSEKQEMPVRSKKQRKSTQSNLETFKYRC